MFAAAKKPFSWATQTYDSRPNAPTAVRYETLST
jgi:hypothetical protein